MHRPVVHFVGSVPLDTPAEVFERISKGLPDQLLRIPDGEPKERGNFTAWQTKVWPTEVRRKTAFPDFDFPEHFDLRAEHLKPSGFDVVAISSYETFSALRERGVIPPGVRFQICIPTPTNVVNIQLDQKYMAHAEILYLDLIEADLKNIQAKIPSKDLAIQFDLCVEVSHMEHAFGQKRDDPSWQFKALVPYYASVDEPALVEKGLLERVTHLAGLVNEDVELGFHLCYGDRDHQHYVQPIDSGILVRLTNGISKAVSRRIQWFHMPVPKDRTDDAYFEPLAGLELKDATLMLGLVHSFDESGTTQRITAARKVLKDTPFGIANECGLGRTPAKELDSILEIYRNVQI